MQLDYRKRFYEKYVQTQIRHTAKYDFKDEYNFRRKIYKLNYKNILPKDKDAHILELGCGAGYFLKYLKELGYQNIHGVDISPEQLELAKKLGGSLYIVQADIFDYLKSTKQKFDMICAFHVLEHLFKNEILELLSFIYEKLNNNGMILIEVPNAGSPLFGGQNRYSEFTHETGFTAPSLKEVLLICEFLDVKVFPIKGVSPYARTFFKIFNYFLHSRFNKDLFIEGEIFGIGYKKN